MPDLFTDFLDKPGAETYLALRRAIVHSEEFDALSVSLTDFADLVEAGDHADVVAAIPTIMPNFILSPSAHFLIAASAENAGDADMAENEITVAHACLHSIDETGDGTRAAPYRCIYVSDQYDLARAKGRTVANQGSVVQDGRHLDILNCDDGTEMCFDMTETLATMAETAGS